MMMGDFPYICGSEDKVKEIMSGNRDNLYRPLSDLLFDSVESSFGIALHMHQPTIPASSDDLSTAELISNLQFMMEHQDV
ncbi:MAG: glycosyl hydrolase family 57, partial [Deltaproteobacteria bacterium]